RVIHVTSTRAFLNRAKLAICEGKSTAFVIPAQGGIQVAQYVRHSSATCPRSLGERESRSINRRPLLEVPGFRVSRCSSGMTGINALVVSHSSLSVPFLYSLCHTQMSRDARRVYPNNVCHRVMLSIAKHLSSAFEESFFVSLRMTIPAVTVIRIDSET